MEPILPKKPQQSMMGGEVGFPQTPLPQGTPQYTNTGTMGLRQAMDNMVDSTPYKVAQLVPGLNVPLSAASYGSHMARGMQGEASLDAVGAIPGAGPLRMIPRVLPNMSRGSVTANAMRGSTLANALGLFY